MPVATSEQLRVFIESIGIRPEVATELVSRMSGEVSRRRFAKQSLVVERGEKLDGLYGVLSGKLKLYMLSCGGNERILRVLEPGDSFGEAIMFNQVPSPVFVQALTHAELAFIPGRCLVEAMADCHDLALIMLRRMSNLLEQLILDLERCCTHNAMQRVAHFLSAQASLRIPPATEIELPAAKAVVASMLNLTPETFSRELHRLDKEGLIRIERRLIRIVDLEGLTRIINAPERA